ncbi:hypothetical protein SARC_10327 [Sphaeroforma arctica JP610]|uniref:Uncharacterized protein n=1 Tax=Sphaeroforma arctica JP610 TaxID=667725 RepID=A0A0L0FMF3_9EUKA|nr:hypothetical protein SARC_10327 [Sphaeroforma arctica JP610]KNC77208.1 hypothetical protein SARC_10327 [Sphaeroforma arctica JP610]|eukprot:XP_014151110.1 hypothetical protein SARC_10327 [Sphaeroforma arctica JP610]
MWFKRKTSSSKVLQPQIDETRRYIEELESVIASLQDQRLLEEKFNNTIVARLETIETQLPMGRPEYRWPARTRSVPVFPLKASLVTPPVDVEQNSEVVAVASETTGDAEIQKDENDCDGSTIIALDSQEQKSVTSNAVDEDTDGKLEMPASEFVLSVEDTSSAENRMSLISTPAHLVKSGALQRAIAEDLPDEATILSRMTTTTQGDGHERTHIPFPEESHMIDLMLLFSETVMVPFVVEELTDREREIDDIVIDLQVACTLSMRIVSAYFSNLNKLVKRTGLPKGEEATFRAYTEATIKTNWSKIFTTNMIGHWYDVKFPETISSDLSDFVISLCAWQYLSGVMGSGILKHEFNFNDLGVSTWYDPLEHKALPSQGLGWNLLQPGDRCSIIWPGLQKQRHVSRVRAIVVPLLRQHEYYSPKTSANQVGDVQTMSMSVIDLTITPSLDACLANSHATMDIDALTSATKVEHDVTRTASKDSVNTYTTAPSTPDMGTSQTKHAYTLPIRQRTRSSVGESEQALSPTTARLRQNTCVYPISWYLQQDEEGIWPELIPVVVPPVPDNEATRRQTLFKHSHVVKPLAVGRPDRKYSKVEDRSNNGGGDWAKMKTIKRARSAIRHGERSHGYSEPSEEEKSTLMLFMGNEAPSKKTIRSWLSRTPSSGRKKSAKPAMIRGVVHY